MIKITKLNKDATIPTRATPLSAGLDLYAVADETLVPGKTALINTGIACAISNGYCGQIWPRSGMSVAGIDRRAGLIDADYRGELKIALRNETASSVIVKKGDRVAQLVILPCWMGEPEVVNSLGDTERSVGGFGSTGK